MVIVICDDDYINDHEGDEMISTNTSVGDGHTQCRGGSEEPARPGFFEGKVH